MRFAEYPHAQLFPLVIGFLSLVILHLCFQQGTMAVELEDIVIGYLVIAWSYEGLSEWRPIVTDTWCVCVVLSIKICYPFSEVEP